MDEKSSLGVCRAQDVVRPVGLYYLFTARVAGTGDMFITCLTSDIMLFVGHSI